MVDFGRDFSCISDCTPDMAEVTGRLLLAQAIARRLGCPRGRLIGSPNYGYDLTQFVNDDLSQADLARIQAGTEAECIKDERVLSAEVTIVQTVDGTLGVKIILTDADGPFSLVLSVTQYKVSIQ